MTTKAGTETFADVIAELDKLAETVKWVRPHLAEVAASKYGTMVIMGSSRAPDFDALIRLRDMARAQVARLGDAHVDLPGLRAALRVVSKHKGLLFEALRDLGHDELTAARAVSLTAGALEHVVSDDFRSSENRGGS